MLYDIALTERFKGFLWDTSSAPGENRKMQLGTDHQGGGGGGGWEWAGGGEFSSRRKFFWLSNSLYEFFLVDSMNIL